MSNSNSSYYSDISGDLQGFYGENRGTVNQYIIAQKSKTEIHSQRLIKGSPYLGLNKFEPEDKDKFFGREQWITKLSKDLEQNNFLVLLGASGSGKSSLVKAGIIPYLSDKWGVSKLVKLIFVPDKNPFESLYISLPNKYKNIATEIINQKNQDGLIKLIDKLKEKSHQWLIFIDQFEEIFTSTSKLKRDQFIANIISLMRQQYSSVKLILAMRSDFLENLREYGDFTNEVESQIRLIRDMTESELRLAIAEPAARNGVTFEKGLVEQIISDFYKQAGSLPLLQYTLDLLWQKNGISDGNRVLNIKIYDDLGGVAGALQKQANYIYKEKLNDAEKKAAEKIFIELIDLGVKEPVSRRVEKPQFRNDPITESALNKLIESRLLISGRDGSTTTVEVAHEELLRSWEFIQNLIQEQEEIILLRSRLIGDANLWDELQKEDEEKAKDELWSGSKLGRVLELIDEKAFGSLDEKSEQFIQVSVERRDRQEKEKEDARQRELEQAQALVAEQQQRAEIEHRAATRLRWLVVGLAVVSLGAVGTAVFAIIQTSLAQRLRSNSIVQALVGQAPLQLEQLKRHERGALLARQAYLFNQRNHNQVLYQSNVNDALRTVLGLRYFSSILRDHTDSIWSVAFSPNSQMMVSSSLDGTIRVWNLLQPRSKPIVLHGHENWVTSVAFSPDGQMLVSGGDDKTVRLWDLRRPDAKPTIFKHKERIWTVAFSSNGHTIASGSEDKMVRLWDLRQPNAQPIVLKGHKNMIRTLAFSSDGQMLASGSDDKTVRLWNLHQPSATPTVLKQEKAVRSVAFSPNGQRLAAGSHDNKVWLWNLRQLNSTPTVLNGHTDIVRSVAFSPDGQFLASSSDDKTVRLWDLRRPNADPTILTGHLEEVGSVAFSSDGQTLASGSDDKTVRLWELGQPSTAPTILRQQNAVSSLGFSPDGNTLASGSRSGYWKAHNLRLWDLRQPNVDPTVITIPSSDGINSVAFSPNGQVLATQSTSRDLGYGGIVQLWNLSQLDSKPTFLREARGCTLPVHGTNGCNLAFSPDGYTLALGGYKEIQLWNLRELETKPVVLRGHENYVRSVAFSPDGRTLASGAMDNTVRLWNLRQPNVAPIILRGHKNYVTSVAFSPDGHTLASGSDDKTVRLWNLRQPKDSPMILRGHENYVKSVAFSPDGHTLASSGNDQTVQLWDMRQPNAEPTILRAVLSSSKDGFSSVTFNPDGQSLAAGSDDGTIRIWNVHTETLADIVCKKVWRNLTLDEWSRFIGEDIPYERTCPHLPPYSETSNGTKPKSTKAPKLVAPLQRFPPHQIVWVRLF